MRIKKSTLQLHKTWTNYIVGITFYFIYTELFVPDKIIDNQSESEFKKHEHLKFRQQNFRIVQNCYRVLIWMLIYRYL